MTTAYDVLRHAIINRLQVVCTYAGHLRLCCPHAIGHTNGIPRVLFYQFDGSSSRGLPPGGEWRCMDIPALKDITARKGEWHTGHRHTKRQTCVQVVDIDITMT